MSRDRTETPESLLSVLTGRVTDHVAPRCMHFGTCGGCQLQDLSQPDQLAAKQQMLVEVLTAARVTNLPAIQTHAADPWDYRNRARMRVQGNEIGYSRRASNEFLPVRECPIVSPRVWQVARALQHAVHSGAARWPVATSSFEIFVNDDESQVQLSLQLDAHVNTVDREAPRDLRMLCAAVQSNVPQLIGAGLSVGATPDPKLSKRLQESQRVEIARWGEPALHYAVRGHTYSITRNAFFQVNHSLTATMVDLVVDHRSGALAYDLFAGAGLFSVPLAERFTEVIAVEIGEPAASDLAAHLRTCGPQHTARRSTTLDFLRQQHNARTPDLIVLDPPRAGLGDAVVRELIRIGALEIVYVSCDAGTFARDARPLVDCGYTLAELHLLDLFPQTFHTETIAVFCR